jgi:hypothetical protein
MMRRLAKCIPSVWSFWQNGHMHMLGDNKIYEIHYYTHTIQ